MTTGPEGTSPVVTRETGEPELSIHSATTERTTFQESTESPTDESTISQELTSQVDRRKSPQVQKEQALLSTRETG